MSIKINLGAWNSIFAVPSKVVDEGLKYSDGVKLKILLYVLRNSGSVLDDDAISKGTGVNVTDIPEALDYWVSMDIFTKTDDIYTPVQSDNFKDFFSDAEMKATDNKINVIPNLEDKRKAGLQKELISEETTEISNKNEDVKPHFTVLRPQKPDFVFTSQRLAVDEELKFLVEEAQTSLGKVLSNSDISTLLMLKDTCGLPLDVILMLIQYCISIDKANMRTIEKIGVQWSDDGIYSVEAADNKIKQIMQTNKNFSIVSAAFGLKNVGSPTKKQLEYGDKWVGEWKFSHQMLREAYERCVDTKGTMNLRYIDGILKRWNADGIHSIEELQKKEKISSKVQIKSKSSYDIDELEKINTLDNL